MKETINIAPSWSGITPLLVHIASHGETHEGRKAALAEIMRMAEIVDNLQHVPDERLPCNMPDDTAPPRESEIAMSLATDHVRDEEREAEDSADMPLIIPTSEARRLDEIDGVLG